MSLRVLLSLSVAAALALVGAPAASADVFGPLGSTEPAAGGPTGHFMVKFAEGTSAADQAAALDAVGATDLSAVGALRLHTVALPDGAADQLLADPSVTRVEAEETRQATGVPNDPGYDSQWALPRIGWDQVFGTGLAGSATVALLDTGVDSSHPDLSGNLLPGTSLLDAGGDGLSDSNGHGTAMAGIVAASTDNAEGVAGVGYAGVKVMPVTVLDGSGTGQDGEVVAGVVWAADHGADVILMPFSSPDYSASLQDALDYAWSKGAVLVAATGNDGSSAAHYPAGDRGVVGVGNTDETDALNASSNFGPALFMAAPGTGVRTTQLGGGYGDASGTSASAAMVAGAAGLLRAASPDADNGVVVGRLARNADPTPNEDTANGRLNLPRAMADDSTGSVKPEGTAPVGGGGPVIGPYRAASNADITGVVRDSTTNGLLSGVTITPTCTGCNNPTVVTYAGGGTTTNATGQYTAAFQYAGNGPATVTVTASKPGYTAIAGSSASVTCNNGGACTGSPFTRNLVLQPSVRSTTTAVACSPGSVVLNQASTCTATVTDSAAGTPASPSGTVTFAAAPGSSGTFGATSCTLSAATASTSQCSVSYTPSSNPGTHTISANYGGSPAHSASAATPGFSLTVAKRSSSTTVVCTPASVVISQASTCTASVSDSSAAGTGIRPSGTVSFSKAAGDAGTLSAASCALPASGANECSVTYTPSAAGSSTITGSYGGDTVHLTSSDDDTVTAAKRDSSTTVTCVPASVVINEASTCTASVSDSSAAGTGIRPSGTVSFSKAAGDAGSLSAASCTLPASGANECSVTYTPSAAGSSTITGSYTGDDNHLTSSDSDSLSATKRESSTSVSCTPASVVINEGSTCTATVSDSSAVGTGIRPSGTVSFSKGAGDAGDFDSPSCTLPSSGPNACSVTYTPSGAGSSTVTGSYSGDDNHLTSSDDDTVTATKRESSTSVTCVPASVVINEGSTCTATVSDSSAAGTGIRPSGTVDFSKAAGDAGSLSAASCTLPATGANECSVTYTPSAAGSSTITGSYAGDSEHLTSSDSDSVSATKRDSSTTVTCTPASVVINEGSTCTATVSDSSAAGTGIRPTGTVDFSKAAGDAGSLSAPSCTLPATGPNECSVTYTPSGAGPSTITGTYAGDSNHLTSSDSDTVTASKRSTSTTVVCTTPVAINQGSQCSATVDDTDVGTKGNPDGTVTFSKGPSDSGDFGSTTCSLNPVSGDPDSSRCTVTYTPSGGVGTHTIGASYGGSAVYLASSDPDGYAITVTKRSTSTTVSCQSPRVLNQASTCSATVDDTDGGSTSNPSGTVTFSRSGAGAGSFDSTTCSLNSVPSDPDSSRCSVTYTPTSGVGTHTINGSYGGSSLHKTSSDNEDVAVNKRPTKLVYTGDTSGDYSDEITLSAKLTDETESPATNLSGRTITFTIGSQTATASTNSNGVASTTLTLTQKAGAYTVGSSYAGDATYLGTSDSDPFAINREGATIEYTGDVLKSTGSTASNSTTTLNLSALVREAADGHLGNKLGEQKLTFTVYASNDSTMSSPKFMCSVNITPSATQGQGTAGCTTTPLAADNYIVKIAMGDKIVGYGYYEAPVEDSTVTIVLAGTGFTTGGGWLNETSLGSRSNFGFTVKYLKNANVQGNSLYIYRRAVAPNTVANPGGGYLPGGSYNWIIKSNAMGGLTQSCSTTTPKVCTASFEGKSNVTAVNRATGQAYSLGGNYSFHVDVTDNSEPGSSPGAGPDTYTIRVWDAATGDYYRLPGFPAQTKIDGGNIQVKP